MRNTIHRSAIVIICDYICSAQRGWLIMVVLWCDSSEKFTSFCKEYYLAILCGCENKWHCDSHKCMQMMTLFREFFPSGKFHSPGVEKIDSQL